MYLDNYKKYSVSFYPSKKLNGSELFMRSSIGGGESRLNKSLIESLVQLFGMTVVLRRGGGFIRGNNGSPRESKKL